MEKILLQCPRCKNRDPTYFYYGSRGWYCRKCVGFSRFLPPENTDNVREVLLPDSQYLLPFALSEKQRRIAAQIKANYEKNNILVYAACGTGKTELMLDFITNALSKGYKVGWAIPRRAVVLQLAERLSQYFFKMKVIPVCQDHTDDIYGDLIICTTHQLFRYYQFFDYLIIDEPDAYPFKDNEVLINIAFGSVRSHVIFLTATPYKKLLARCDTVCELFERPHGQLLDIPRIIHILPFLNFLTLFYLLRRQKGKLLVFIPSIKEALTLQAIFAFFFDCKVITSLSQDKEEIVTDFIRQETGILFSTTVLERGVTIPAIDVIVYKADSDIFDLAALIQMAGRVGRTTENPHGKIFFLSNHNSAKLKKCIKLLDTMNQNA